MRTTRRDARRPVVLLLCPTRGTVLRALPRCWCSQQEHQRELTLECVRGVQRYAAAAAEAAGAIVHIDVLQRAPSAATPKDHPAAQALARIVGQVGDARPASSCARECWVRRSPSRKPRCVAVRSSTRCSPPSCSRDVAPGDVASRLGHRALGTTRHRRGPPVAGGLRSRRVDVVWLRRGSDGDHRAARRGAGSAST